MITDKQGNILSNATRETADLLDQAVRVFNIYRGDPFGPLDRAMELAPRFAMAPIAKALLFAMAAEPGAVREAGALLEKAKKLSLSEREASHVAVIEKVIAGEWTAAARLMDRHNASYPHDLLALQAGHVIDFYNCNARSLRELWHLRSELFSLVSVHRGQHDAQARLNALNRHFPIRAAGSGFGGLDSSKVARW